MLQAAACNSIARAYQAGFVLARNSGPLTRPLPHHLRPCISSFMMPRVLGVRVVHASHADQLREDAVPRTAE
eukprot:4634750-Heterocapsa_arctica.AAC.1